MGVYELPLFPLNTVLFPGMPLQLHIFEERYRQMVAFCRAANSPFGVVMIRHGAEAHGPLAQPHMIGCTAHMAQLLPLPDGRYNLIAAGMDRFRIQSVLSDRPYLVGIVEDIPLDTGDITACTRAEDNLRPWLEEYIRKLAPPDEHINILNRVPDSPERLAYFAAAMLQVPPVQKQALLEIDDCPHLLEQLTEIYRREIAIVQQLAAIPPPDQTRGFSMN